MRFCAKFHLQMCAVLSQFGNHLEAVELANKACIFSEDNMEKTYLLFSLIGDFNKDNLTNNLENNNPKISLEVDNSESYVEKILQ